jgi:hypothetical protein
VELQVTHKVSTKLPLSRYLLAFNGRSSSRDICQGPLLAITKSMIASLIIHTLSQHDYFPKALAVSILQQVNLIIPPLGSELAEMLA